MSLETVLAAGLGFASGSIVGSVIIPVVTATRILPKELDDFIRNRMKIVVYDPAGTRIIVLLTTDETLVMEIAGLPNDWCKAMCQIGFSDRGTPYDGRGRGEATLRLWWGKSPNVENYEGELWFAELWFGGVWNKTWQILDSRRGWLDALNYRAEAQLYVEMHPDGHIMNF